MRPQAICTLCKVRALLCKVKSQTNTLPCWAGEWRSHKVGDLYIILITRALAVIGQPEGRPVRVMADYVQSLTTYSLVTKRGYGLARYGKVV